MSQLNFKKPIVTLLVEDDPADAFLIKESLGKWEEQLNLYHVDTGVKAIHFLKQEEPYPAVPTPDLILLDLNLPARDGISVLQEIKATAELKKIPIVILTTSSLQADIDRCYDLGASSYITKPVDLQSFSALVRSMEDFWFGKVRFPSIKNDREKE